MFLVDVVIGAGISGLSCARLLQRAGRDVLVLEKARGVGGRCATRRIDGQPVDLGVTFLHGSDRRFLQALDEVSADRAVDWPLHIVGEGPWCSPNAVDHERRVVFPSGLTAFPKHLASGLRIQLGSTVSAIVSHDTKIELTLTDAPAVTCRQLVLALPLEQAQALLATAADQSPDLRAAVAIMNMASTSSCLTIAALYSLETPDPGFDLFHPGLDSCLALVSHDSRKRSNPLHRVLVMQARTGWSRRHLDVPAKQWGDEMLQEAARLLGEWVRAPIARYEHRWRFARLDGAPAFRGPVLVPLRGATVGLTGEGVSEGGGVQGAFIAGLDLAERILEQT